MAASNKPETYNIVPRCLLTLHEKANGTELDGEGIQAWVEWEMEAMQWKVPIDISRDELEALVDSSEVPQLEEHQLLQEGTRPEPETVGGKGTPSKPPETISKGEERACR